MAFDNKYPYTDVHELNLDWVLEQVTGLDDRFDRIEEAIDTLRRETVENIQRIDGEIRSINDTIRLINADIADLIVQWRQVAPDFDETVVYHQDNYVFHNGILYRRKENTPEMAGTWNPSYWEHVTVADRLQNYDWSISTLFDQGSAFSDMFDELSASIGSEYNSESTYSEGELVMYNQVLYKASQAVPVGMDPINHPEYWTADSIVNEIGNLDIDYPEISVSGEPSVTIRDAIGTPVRDLYVTMNIRQDGTGKPTPSNVRDFIPFNTVSANVGNGGDTRTVTARFLDPMYMGNYDFKTGDGEKPFAVFSFSECFLYGNYGDDNQPLYYVNIQTATRIRRVQNSSNTAFLYSNYFSRISVPNAASLLDNEIRTNASSVIDTIYFRSDSYTLEELNAMFAVKPLVVVAELVDHQTFHLTPATIDLFKAFNIIWTDADKVDLTYEYMMQYPVYQTGTDAKIGVTGDGKAVMLREIVETGLPSGTNNLSGLFDWTDVESILLIEGCIEGEQDGIVYTVGAFQSISRPSGDGEFFINSAGTNTSYTLKLMVKYIAE